MPQRSYCSKNGEGHAAAIRCEPSVQGGAALGRQRTRSDGYSGRGGAAWTRHAWGAASRSSNTPGRHEPSQGRPGAFPPSPGCEGGPIEGLNLPKALAVHGKSHHLRSPRHQCGVEGIGATTDAGLVAKVNSRLVLSGSARHARDEPSDF